MINITIKGVKCRKNAKVFAKNKQTYVFAIKLVRFFFKKEINAVVPGGKKTSPLINLKTHIILIRH